MYDQCKAGLVASGNAVRYEHPVHMDANGKIVEDESLAFGRPVTINYLHLENVFFWTRPEIIRTEKMMGIKGFRGKSFRKAKFKKSWSE